MATIATMGGWDGSTQLRGMRGKESGKGGQEEKCKDCGGGGGGGRER